MPVVVPFGRIKGRALLALPGRSIVWNPWSRNDTVSPVWIVSRWLKKLLISGLYFPLNDLRLGISLDAIFSVSLPGLPA